MERKASSDSMAANANNDDGKGLLLQLNMSPGYWALIASPSSYLHTSSFRESQMNINFG